MSRILDPNFVKYKFRDLKVYASTEWLADNKKKYRQVFDRHEATYIYAELSFYNKLFDDEDWNVQINIKCYSLKKGRKELCDLNFDRKVSKYDNIVYIREGWGNKKAGLRPGSSGKPLEPFFSSLSKCFATIKRMTCVVLGWRVRPSMLK